ncbi:hypothetical protein Mapa_014891 [Marchantia paleacea]|nr:hypothetical protein Mapa_014891 [Marchantia paleacea]
MSGQRIYRRKLCQEGFSYGWCLRHGRVCFQELRLAGSLDALHDDLVCDFQPV